MKIFFYKSLITFVLVFIFYQLTIGAKVRDLESKINNISSKENIEYIKDKVREEMKNAINKDKYFEEQDAILLRNFLDKISSELKIKPN
tara:strand:+ start:447 stop:713 length:267 start_codon:yes stop_codon:yes gene_type:complete